MKIDNFKNEVIPFKSLCVAIDDEVDAQEQIAYIDSELSLIGMDRALILEYSKSSYLNKEASPLLQTVESFFYTMNDFVNYFITHYTDPQLEAVSKQIVSDGSLAGEFFALHFIDSRRSPNIIPFSFSKLVSSGMLKTEELTQEKTWDKTRIVLFGAYYDEKDEDFDLVVLEKMKAFVPMWIKMMKEIKKISV